MPSLEPPDVDRSGELMQLEPSEVMARYRSGRLSRREILKLFSALGLTTLGMNAVRHGSSAAGELKAIIWEGYTDDTYKLPFETATDSTVTATFAASGDEMFALMRESDGKNYDTVSASSDLPRRLYDAGLLAEIDTTKLTNYDKLYDQFKSPDYITFDGKLYGVNFAWGPTIMLYDANTITTAPTSWNALLDEQYSGKISTWNYPIQIAQYALLLDPQPANPYELTDEQLAQVKDILIKQRPLIRKYWDYGQDVAELFKSGEIVISDGWPWVTLQINAEKGNAVEVTPTEGVTGWSDSWCISKNAQDYDLALKWADWMIGDEAQLGITNVMNYGITNKGVVESMTPERRAELRMTDVEVDYAKIHMWPFIPAYDKWVQIWTEATQG